MKSEIEKALDLAKITGDRVIIVDEKQRRSFVIISLDEYEKLVKKSPKLTEISNLTEEELLDKINRDIAFFKQTSKNKELEASDLDFSKEEESEEEEDDIYYYSSEDGVKDSFNDFSQGPSLKSSEEDLEEREDDEKELKGCWNIPGRVKRGAEIVEE